MTFIMWLFILGLASCVAKSSHDQIHDDNREAIEAAVSKLTRYFRLHEDDEDEPFSYLYFPPAQPPIKPVIAEFKPAPYGSRQTSRKNGRPVYQQPQQSKPSITLSPQHVQRPQFAALDYERSGYLAPEYTRSHYPESDYPGSKHPNLQSDFQKPGPDPVTAYPEPVNPVTSYPKYETAQILNKKPQRQRHPKPQRQHLKSQAQPQPQPQPQPHPQPQSRPQRPQQPQYPQQHQQYLQPQLQYPQLQHSQEHPPPQRQPRPRPQPQPQPQQHPPPQRRPRPRPPPQPQPQPQQHPPPQPQPQPQQHPPPQPQPQPQQHPPPQPLRPQTQIQPLQQRQHPHQQPQNSQQQPQYLQQQDSQPQYLQQQDSQPQYLQQQDSQPQPPFSPLQLQHPQQQRPSPELQHPQPPTSNRKPVNVAPSHLKRTQLYSEQARTHPPPVDSYLELVDPYPELADPNPKSATPYPIPQSFQPKSATPYPIPQSFQPKQQPHQKIHQTHRKPQPSYRKQKAKQTTPQPLYKPTLTKPQQSQQKPLTLDPSYLRLLHLVSQQSQPQDTYPELIDANQESILYPEPIHSKLIPSHPEQPHRNRKPATSNRNPASSNRNPASSNRKPASSYPKPTPKNQESFSPYPEQPRPKQPRRNRKPASTNRKPASSYPESFYPEPPHPTAVSPYPEPPRPNPQSAQIRPIPELGAPAYTNVQEHLNGHLRNANFEEQDQPEPFHNQAIPEGVNTRGEPGRDYPIFASIPDTRFSCSDKQAGFYGDPDTHCQVWHYCDLHNHKSSFLCTNGTIYNQIARVCDWWFNVDCDSSASFYSINDDLYKHPDVHIPDEEDDYEDEFQRPQQFIFK